MCIRKINNNTAIAFLVVRIIKRYETAVAVIVLISYICPQIPKCGKIQKSAHVVFL